MKVSKHLLPRSKFQQHFSILIPEHYILNSNSILKSTFVFMELFAEELRSKLNDSHRTTSSCSSRPPPSTSKVEVRPGKAKTTTNCIQVACKFFLASINRHPIVCNMGKFIRAKERFARSMFASTISKLLTNKIWNCSSTPTLSLISLYISTAPCFLADEHPHRVLTFHNCILYLSNKIISLISC